MSQSAVRSILEMIDALSDVEQELLQRQLDQRANEQWRGESEKARREANSRGIDQIAIDEAIRKRRYGA